jgi:hypothetical protein
MAASQMAIRTKIRKYKNIFIKTHATVPERAIRPWDYGITRGMIFNRLVRNKILVPTENDKYYFDELRDNRLNKRSSLITIIGLVIIILAVFIFFMRKFI